MSSFPRKKAKKESVPYSCLLYTSFSFVVGFAFSEMLDVHKLWISGLPMGLGWQLLYFVVSYLLLCFGIALANRCQLPIIPTDLFPRDLSNIIGAKYSRVKISFDVICLAVTGLMTGLFLGHLDGLGTVSYTHLDVYKRQEKP